MDFLNKLYTKVVFSDAPNLNIGAYDMGIEQCKVSLSKPGVARLETATGTIGSAEIFVPVTISISVKKTSPVFEYYQDRILNNGYLGGSVTVYTDTNTSITATEPSIKIDELGDLNGTQAAVTFDVEANLKVNKQMLAGF